MAPYYEDDDSLEARLGRMGSPLYAPEDSTYPDGSSNSGKTWAAPTVLRGRPGRVDEGADVVNMADQASKPPAIPTSASLKPPVDIGSKTVTGGNEPGPTSTIQNLATPWQRQRILADQTMAQLMAERAAKGVPINPRDEQGKMKKEYRMGLGQRILGALADFGMGFSGRGGEPVYIGPGATNQRYADDEARRQAEAGNLDVQIRNAREAAEEGRMQSAIAQQAQDRADIAEQRRVQAANNSNRVKAGLAEHGLQMDDEGNISPLPEDQLSADQRARLNKPPSRDQQRNEYQRLTAKMEKAGELTYPDNVIKQRDAIRKSRALTPDERSAALGYLNANSVPGDRVIVAGRPLTAREQMMLKAQARKVNKKVEDLTFEERDEALHPNRRRQPAQPGGGNPPRSNPAPGTTNPPTPNPRPVSDRGRPGQQLSREQAAAYLKSAKNDRQAARSAAIRDGYTTDSIGRPLLGVVSS